MNGDATPLTAGAPALPRTATRQLPSTPRPIQRAGHIGSDDNRFCGASVFDELARRAADPTALLCLAFGMPLPDADGREVLRLAALSVTSPDARVWPLKMTRVLSSYGNPFAGYFAAQLANYSDRMGPGTAAHAAVSLRWLDERLTASAERRAPPAPSARATLDDDIADYPPAAVAAAVAEHLASRGRIAGFGVPFRKDDERRVGLLRLLSGHPAQRGRAWRLHLQVVEAMSAKETLQPNIVISLAALFLDLGLPAERAGLFLTMMMSQNFAAHAIEASERDQALLQELPARFLEDQSAPPRRSPRARAHLAANGTASSADL